MFDKEKWLFLHVSFLFIAPAFGAATLGGPDDIRDADGNHKDKVYVTGRSVNAPEDTGGGSARAMIRDFRTPYDLRKSHPRADSIKKNASIRNPCENLTTANPVVIATGEKFKDEVDFSAVNPYSFSLTRTYRSKLASGSLFGPNWMSTLDIPSLKFDSAQCRKFPNGECVPQSVTVTDVTGAPVVYTLGVVDVEHQFVYDAPDGSALYYDYGVRWRLDKNKKTYVYSNAGVIGSVDDPILANTLTYRHSGGRLESISSRSGHKVGFVWTNDRVTQVVDPSGGVWVYEYNANKMLRKVTSPGGREWREYHYEDANPILLTGISFNGVRYSTYKYYSDGRVSESGLTGGEEVDKFVYSVNATSVTNALGQTTTYKFADIAESKKIIETVRQGTTTCPLGAAVTGYDGNGHIDYTLDWKGNRTDLDFDGQGRLLRRVTAHGTAGAAVEKYTWDIDNVTQIEYADSNWKAYLRKNIEYDVQGRVSGESLTDIATGVVRRTDYIYSSHPNGVVATQTINVQLGGGQVATTVSSFDTAGNLVSVSNPVQHISSWEAHDEFGNPRTFIDPNNVKSTFTYNAWGGVETFTDHNGNVTTWTYTPARQLAGVAYPDGRSDKYKYNDGGRLIESGNARDEYVKHDFDIKTNRMRTSSPRHVPALSGGIATGALDGEFSAVAIFDSLSRPYTRLGNDGQKQDIRYDSNGNVTTITDAKERATSFEYDAQNRMVKLIAADGGVILKSYDSRGNLEVVTDPRGLKTVYTYDGFGAVKSVKSPDTGLTTYDYDTVGQLVKMTAADNRVTTFGRDKLGRRTSRCSNKECHLYTYDGGAYGKGRLSGFEDWTGNTSYEYNAAGQLVSQTNNIYGQIFRTTWGYDTVGRLDSMIYPTGLVLTYEYDRFGRRSAVKSATPLKAKN